MYKVFLNERVIMVSHSANPVIIKDSVIIENLNSVEETKTWFGGFIAAEVKNTSIMHPNPEVFWNKIFTASFKLIVAAGGVVKRKNEFLFILRNGKWDLPKGKVDFGETITEAALREVSEECGISGHQIVTALPSTFHLFQSTFPESFSEWILKETHWFEMKYTENENGTPQTEENITEIRWFKKEELGEVLQNTWSNLKPVVNYYMSANSPDEFE